jgi:small subunit ribosomal protein S17
MAKVLTGKVISVKMKDTVVVEISRRVPHPLYKKLLKRTKHFNADLGGHEVVIGDTVKIVETKPMSKTKYFKISEVLKQK